MKLHQESSGALNTITSYGAGYVAINLERHEGSIIVMPEGAVIQWPVSSFEALAPEHFEALVAAAPEVVIFGSGSRLRFPHPRLTAALTAKHRIGVETMDFKRRLPHLQHSDGRGPPRRGRLADRSLMPGLSAALSRRFTKSGPQCGKLAAVVAEAGSGTSMSGRANGLPTGAGRV